MQEIQQEAELGSLKPHLSWDYPYSLNCELGWILKKVFELEEDNFVSLQ